MHVKELHNVKQTRCRGCNNTIDVVYLCPIFSSFDAEHTGHDKVAYLLIIKSALVAQKHKKLCSYVEMYKSD